MTTDREAHLRGLRLVRRELNRLEKSNDVWHTVDLPSGQIGYHRWEFGRPVKVEINGDDLADIEQVELGNPCGHVMLKSRFGRLYLKGFAEKLTSFQIND